MTVVDFHSHILPGIDDGSGSVEESVALLRLEAEQGIGRVIATPHFYPQHDTPEHFLEKRRESMSALSTAISQLDGMPQIVMGAEVYFFRGMSSSDQLRRLTIGGKNCILVEMPPAPWTEDMYRELEQIWVQQGLVPVIAHIDRYIRPFGTQKMLRRLAELPVLIQANAAFFQNKRTARMALQMLKMDQIHLLGSDCHNLMTRKPNLDAALQKICSKLGESAIQRINQYERKALRE